MRAHWCRWCILGLVSTLVLPRVGAAQTSIELAPLIGVYAPLGTFGQTNAYSAFLPNKPSTLGGPAWGAQGRLWLGPRFGIQLQAAVARSSWTTPPSPGPRYFTLQESAAVVAATVLALFRPVPAGLPLWLGAGAGVVVHKGQAYVDTGAGVTSSFAGALAIGVDLHLYRALSATAAATTLFYSLDVGVPSVGSIERGFQTDLLVHVGLAWRIRVG